MPSQLEKLGNFALFMNFVITIFYILITWDGSGTITFYIPEDIPFGSDRQITFTMFGMVVTIVVVLMVIAGIVGIQVFGSGLQDSSVEYITQLSSKVVVYLVSSVFSYLIFSVLGNIGIVMFWLLTFFFVIGLAESMFQKGGNE